jgi:uncharacterized membrane protein
MNVLHPPFVHFVIALPFAALFSQLTFLATKDETYSKAATRILAFAFLVGLFAIYGGISDAQKILSDGNILPYGKAILKNHRNLGIITVIVLAITTILKWYALDKKSFKYEKLSLVFIILTILFTLYQGNMGGKLVYKYSAGIDNKIIKLRSDEIKK